MAMARTIRWEEPNRRNTPPLHIASRGTRISTLTGVTWLDESRFVVNHRSGERVALFDLRCGESPVAVGELPHLTDGISAHRLSEHEWEIAVSGCWDAVHSRLVLRTKPAPSFSLLETRPAADRTFCHGLRYDPEGRIWLALSTGEDPRIEIDREGRCWRLPAPWGARDVCFDPDSGAAWAVAVSNVPQLSAYRETAVGVWVMGAGDSTFALVRTFEGLHADACRVHSGRLWFACQRNDRVLGFELSGREPDLVLQGLDLDFPHGVDVSPTGMLAVTNYGTSTVTLVDLGLVGSRELTPGTEVDGVTAGRPPEGPLVAVPGPVPAREPPASPVPGNPEVPAADASAGRGLGSLPLLLLAAVLALFALSGR